MNKTMILAILVAYKAFNDKSLTVVVNKGEGEYVVNKAIIDNIDGNNFNVYLHSFVETGILIVAVLNLFKRKKDAK